jgi:hypothetical protein
MKWLIIQSDGVHKGQDGWEPNWYLRECYSLQDALWANGEAADIWGLRHPNFEQPPDINDYDALLLAENYEFDWIPSLNWGWRPLRFQWIIDLHCQPAENYLKFSCTVDVVLHSTRQLIEPFKARCPKPRHRWFPNPVDDEHFFPDPSVDRDIDCLFIGGRGERREDALRQMETQVGMFYGYGITGKEYIRHLRRTKIGFNKNVGVDLNYRTFELLATGTCLLTEYDPCLDDLGFVHGTNCLLYSSTEEAVALARESLASGSWKQIGEAGYELSKKHTYRERIRDLLRSLP